jgi:hypothetical protein
VTTSCLATGALSSPSSARNSIVRLAPGSWLDVENSIDRSASW